MNVTTGGAIEMNDRSAPVGSRKAASATGIPLMPWGEYVKSAAADCLTITSDRPATTRAPSGSPDTSFREPAGSRGACGRAEAGTRCHVPSGNLIRRFPDATAYTVCPATATDVTFAPESWLSICSGDQPFPS